MNKCELLKGIKPVCDAFEINEDQFYMFLAMGLPMRKINGRWYGHRENISQFFRKVTVGPPASVDGAKAKDIAGEDAY